MMNAIPDGFGLQTKVLHSSDSLNETSGITAPIWQTSTFGAQSAEHMAALAESIRPDEFYTRYGNPTHRQVAATIAALEGGESALVMSSGMGAIYSAVMSLLQKGDHVVTQHSLYSATTKLFRDVAPRWGIECTFVDQTKTEEFITALRPNTKLMYLESPSNPLLNLTDLQAVAEVARERGVMTIIDNTFATPINQQPLKIGIDAVVHSATKYLGGHHDLMAGAVVGSAAFVNQVWDFSLVSGAVLSPFDAWLLHRGLKTLGLRVERQNRNAMALAQFLEGHAMVTRVNYPGLESHPQHALARRQMSGFTGMMSIEVSGGAAAVSSFIASLKLAECAVSLGGLTTVVVPAAAMWSHQHTTEQRRAAGIGPGLVRISVGAEDERDLLADFAQALEA